MDDRPKRKRKNWSEPDEIRLLGVWEENIKDLKKTRRNSHIYQRMADSFPGHTAEEVHIKISNFTQRYRTERKAAEDPKAGPSSWKYYSIVDRILRPNGMCEEGGNPQIEELGDVPKEFSYKEEASSEVTAYSSSSPLTPPTFQPLLQQLEATFPSLRFPLLIPSSLSGSQDSPLSSPGSNTKKPIFERKRSRLTLHREALEIAKENQNLLREQIEFSREAIKEQMNMVSHSIELIKESTENSKSFSSKICEISQRQLELENSFMNFMKKIFSKNIKRKRKN